LRERTPKAQTTKVNIVNGVMNEADPHSRGTPAGDDRIWGKCLWAGHRRGIGNQVYEDLKNKNTHNLIQKQPKELNMLLKRRGANDQENAQFY
jgi:hypothetical protein